MPLKIWILRELLLMKYLDYIVILTLLHVYWFLLCQINIRFHCVRLGVNFTIFYHFFFDLKVSLVCWGGLLNCFVVDFRSISYFFHFFNFFFLDPFFFNFFLFHLYLFCFLVKLFKSGIFMSFKFVVFLIFSVGYWWVSCIFNNIFWSFTNLWQK